MSENSSFMASINAFVDKAKASQAEVVRVVSIKILARLVHMSPVGNPDEWKVNVRNVYARETHNLFVEAHNADLGNKPGRLRRMGQQRLEDTYPSKAPPNYMGGRFKGNWQVSFDAPTTEETGRIDEKGNATIAAGNMVIEQFRVGMTAVYFCNSVPYAYPLEFGHSQQAPGGMVRLTAAEFQRLFDESVREVSS